MSEGSACGGQVASVLALGQNLEQPEAWAK